MPEPGDTSESEAGDWTARHARTRPNQTRRAVVVPDDADEDWEIRHAETKRDR